MSAYIVPGCKIGTFHVFGTDPAGVYQEGYLREFSDGHDHDIIGDDEQFVGDSQQHVLSGD